MRRASHVAKHTRRRSGDLASARAAVPQPFAQRALYRRFAKPDVRSRWPARAATRYGAPTPFLFAW